MRHLLKSPWQTDWFRLDYLADGNQQQRLSRTLLHRLGIFTRLRSWRPVLVGTIPLGCDLPESDLDILLQVADDNGLLTMCRHNWGQLSGFSFKRKDLRGGSAIIIRFSYSGKSIEIVGMNTESSQQYAYAHMIAEALLLHRNGLRNRHAIRRLKARGLTTEEAFAKHFALTGDPYERLYAMYKREQTKELNR